jgi:ATP/ADP translocase
MFNKIQTFRSYQAVQKYLNLDKYDFIKLLLLAGAFFCIIGSYSILRSLKTSIFLGMVGKEYQPISRLISLVIIFPCGFLYSKLVDKLKRQQIFCTVIGIYAVLSLAFAILLAHPTIGVKNTVTSSDRLLGWSFEIFMDMYSALVLTTFWGYANSIATPTFANKSYGLITAISRAGGVITPLIGLLFLHKLPLATHTSIPILVFIGALLLVLAIYCGRKIGSDLPPAYLNGYSDLHEETAPVVDKKDGTKPNIFEGIKLMLTQPYVMGIFGLVYSMEVIAIIFDYQMQVLMSIETNNNIGSMSSFMFVYTSSFQALGLVFALFGTSTLLKRFGTLVCLLIVPVAVFLLSILTFLYPSLSTIFFVMIVLRAINYGFNYPVRETLYIPTVKDIQFKAKLWIDSFGKTFSKSSGSLFNQMLLYFSSNPYFILRVDSIYCVGIALVYGVVSLMVGRKYQKTILAGEIIGRKS